MGDYNIIPEDKDCYDPKAWIKDALFQPESKAALRRHRVSRLHRCLPRPHPAGRAVHLLGLSGGRLAKNHGIRIDHILLSPQGADRLERLRHRQACARRRQAVRPCAGVGRIGHMSSARLTAEMAAFSAILLNGGMDFFMRAIALTALSSGLAGARHGGCRGADKPVARIDSLIATVEGRPCRHPGQGRGAGRRLDTRRAQAHEARPAGRRAYHGGGISSASRRPPTRR